MKNYDNLVGLILSMLVTAYLIYAPRRAREALMTQNVLEVIILLVLLVISTPLLGNYMAKVFQNKKAPGDRVFCRWSGPLPGHWRESRREQRWTIYAISLLAFSLVSCWSSTGCSGSRPTFRSTPTISPRSRRPSPSTRPSASSPTPTGRTTRRGHHAQFTQMAGLVVQMFVSAAVGIAVAVALIRGLVREQVEHTRELLGRPHQDHHPHPSARWR